VITRVRGAGEIDLRSFALTDMVKWGYSGLRSAGAPVSESAIRGIPAIHRAARIRAEALASLRLRVWRGDGPDRTRVDTDWRARLFRGAPNEYCSRFAFWETVGESLAYRNNAYVWKTADPETGRIVELYALHPDQVRCKGWGKYEVEVRGGYVDPVGKGKGIYKVDDATILHVRGHGNGGTAEAPTLIQNFREALAAPVARQRHETRMWAKGSALKAAVVFPGGVSKEQGDVWKTAWRSEYEGAEGETTAFLGGGADIKPIGMTMQDAQYVQMAHLTVEDASRIMGVPANLIGGVQTTQQATTLEQDLATWLRFGLGPELERIESALESDWELFGPRALLYPMFDTENFVRGDVMTEDTVAHNQVQDGRLLVDEWRHSKGLPPLPNGAGSIPQVVPVGGGPNPASAPAPSSNGASAE
jgi:HK97 family phage portal protein